MARKVRVEYEGAIYHVKIRGDRREAIFHDDEDRRCFIETLGECCAKTDWQVHALCLMSNHLDARAEPGGGDEKIASRLREETVMTLKWIARRLQMGASTPVSNRLAKKCQK